MRSVKPRIILSGVLEGGRYSSGAQQQYGTLLATPNLPQLYSKFQADPNDYDVDASGSGVRWSLSNYDGGIIDVVNGTDVRMQYPAPATNGSAYCFLGIGNLPASLSDVYIQFDAKFTLSRHAVKFCKFHGLLSVGNNGYANATYGLSDGGAITQVSFGDGSATTNDTANTIELSGQAPGNVGRSYPATANVQVPRGVWQGADWGNDVWHTFRIHQKFNTGTNSGNEVADGMSYLEIDGQVYVNASGLFNRHPTNPSLDWISLGDWAQGQGSTVNDPFTIVYRNIRVSTGGWLP